MDTIFLLSMINTTSSFVTNEQTFVLLFSESTLMIFFIWVYIITNEKKG